MAAKFVILRHGRSAWNKLNKFTGWNDVPLCDIGVKEANNAALLIKNLNTSLIMPFLVI